MDYDVIIVGGGHAGIEASLAVARLGFKALLITQNPDTIGWLSCNPSIGGLAKGNLVREIDALGGQMGLLIDANTIQYRMLNKSRGPAVQAPRTQADKAAYAADARAVLEAQPNLSIFMDTVTALLVDDKSDKPTCIGVATERGNRISSKAVIVTTGTFMDGRVFIGEYRANSGRLGEPAAMGLGTWLRQNGFPVGRMKTGTPARIKSSSVDLSVLDKQPGDETRIPFSFINDTMQTHEVPCYITFTNNRTHDIIRANIKRSPLYSGEIVGKGPRYCPSIEDKIVKFPDRDKHQIFVEPEGLYTDELYLSGLSSSLPEEVQVEFIHTMQGFEKAFVVRPGYAVEYDYIDPLDLYASLESKRMSALFFAGQTNGTSGYEEAAAQGLVAGINAVLLLQKSEPIIFSRSNSYIGVLIDDIVTLGTKEPYRLFTSRAERRLALRHDNADIRLTPIAINIGLASEKRQKLFEYKTESLSIINDLLKSRKISSAESYDVLKPHIGESLALALRDPRVAELDTTSLCPDLAKWPKALVDGVIMDLRYEGYIAKEERLSARLGKLDAMRIPVDFNYKMLLSISTESLEKLSQAKPLTLGQAARVPGVRPSDIALLALKLTGNKV